MNPFLARSAGIAGILLVSSSLLVDPVHGQCPTVQGERIAPDLRLDSPSGFGHLADHVRENRIAVAAGRLTPEEAEATGGTAISGSKEFPVFPFLYSNTGAAPYSSSQLQQQLFDGPWTPGTMTEYYSEISYGLFEVGGTVHDWYTVSLADSICEGSNNGLGPSGGGRLDDAFLEILDSVDPGVDFGQWDNDGPDGVPNSGDDDGYVDFLAFVHPEFGGEAGGANVWSHRWDLSGWTGSAYETDDPSDSTPGKIRISSYLVTGAIDTAGNQSGIGTFCHEFGHALGIKDLYDTDSAETGSSQGIGYWGLMGSGNYQTPSSPAHMTAWSKERLGWLSYFNVTDDTDGLCVPPVETTPIALRLWKDGESGSEYFVVENRQPIGFDAGVLGEGLVIYHIDEDVYDSRASSNKVNADETLKAIDVECADASSAGHTTDADDLDASLNRGDSGDVWCSSTQSRFDASSIPDSRAYSGGDSEVAVEVVSGCGADTICVDVEVGLALNHDICIQDCATDSCGEITSCDIWWDSPDLWIDNNGDGVQDPPSNGLENCYWYRFRNNAASAISNVTVALWVGAPAIGHTWPSGLPFGIDQIPLVEAGEIVTGYVTALMPFITTPNLDNYSLGATIYSTLDPISSGQARFDNNVAEVCKQQLFSRTGPSPTASTGLFEKFSDIELSSGVNETATVELRVRHDGLPAHWFWQLDPDFGPWTLDPGEKQIVTLLVGSTSGAHGETGRFELELVRTDVSPEELVGGVIQEYQVDDVRPRRPINVTARFLPPGGDDLQGPNVRLGWRRVDKDVTGGAESVEKYEIFRTNPADSTYVYLQSVALAEESSNRFYFYDTVLVDCETDPLLYQVRAVDAAGNRSPFSDPAPIECPDPAASDEPVEVAVTGVRIQPNPLSGIGAGPATISFATSGSGQVDVTVYDVGGRQIRSLHNGTLPAGTHEVLWDGRDADGAAVAAGMYFVRVHDQTGERSAPVLRIR